MEQLDSVRGLIGHKAKHVVDLGKPGRMLLALAAHLHGRILVLEGEQPRESLDVLEEAGGECRQEELGRPGITALRSAPVSNSKRLCLARASEMPGRMR
jgi:hypothetical protein